MNSGLVEARELAVRMARILRAEGSTALLDEFARRDATRPGVGSWAAGRAVRTLAAAHPWVKQNRGEDRRLRACVG